VVLVKRQSPASGVRNAVLVHGALEETSVRKRGATTSILPSCRLAMLEELEKVTQVREKAAKKSLHTRVSAEIGEEDAMLHEWFCVVLKTSVQLALGILPAAPLLGQKLPSIAGEERFNASQAGEKCAAQGLPQLHA
jgi:hypothetical protein